MSRTVSSNRIGGETFEGLLERLTQRAGSSDSPAKFDSAFVSDSSAVAASLPGVRRRALTPVTEVKSGGSKADIMPLSYEKALRLHARRSLAPDTDLRNPGKEDAHPGVVKTSRENVSAGQFPKTGFTSRAVTAPAQRPSRIAAQGSEIGASRRDTGKRASKRKTETAGMAAHPAVAGRGEAQGSVPSSQQTPAPRAKRTSVAPRSQIKANAPAKLQGSAGSMTRKSTSKSRNGSGAATETRTQLAQLPRTEREKTTVRVVQAQQPAGQLTRQRARGDTMRPEELQLELQHGNLQLEHRHAVVSIRLNDSEIERLRQRAAESGISVSAYMRSCVLDAEHLRAQVKQALAEMRASIQPKAFPVDQAQLPSRLTVVTSTGSGEASAWSRLLWKSATFLLGPWFFFRHRA